jgi:hypothetical protein
LFQVLFSKQLFDKKATQCVAFLFESERNIVAALRATTIFLGFKEAQSAVYLFLDWEGSRWFNKKFNDYE